MGGYYTSNGFHAGIFSYLFGPRINLRGHGKVTPFAQVLLGGARSIDNSSLNASAIRPVQAEYCLTKFTDGASNRQNNFRYGAGVVFRFATR